MRISIIVPSRLQPNPVSEVGNLYLDRALTSIQRQVDVGAEIEIIVALDSLGHKIVAPLPCEECGGKRGHVPDCAAMPGIVTAPGLPARFQGGAIRTVASAGGNGQAAAVNAGVKAATGDVLAFLEDDDQWYPDKLRYQLPLLQDHDFVSCNQREVDEWTNFLRVNNFATPSGWLMKREVWEEVGPMDETFKWHVDTEWLGRLNRSGLKRAHLVSAGAEAPQNDPRGWLPLVAKHSAIIQHDDIMEPLVARTVNSGGGMAQIASKPEEAQQSRAEHETMMARFGEVPW